MKKILLLLFIACSVPATAQNWVIIPDDNFANKLNELFPSCMDGNQMDTECIWIVNATSLNVSGSSISDLTGLEHFVNLELLNCTTNYLTQLPVLPIALTTLYCQENQLTSLPELPPALTSLICFENNLNLLPELPASLTTLSCRENNLNSLPELPASLTSLSCGANNLDSLPELPSLLYTLSCSDNNLTSLPELPTPLMHMNCTSNNLTSLPELPQALEQLVCHSNNLNALPDLPPSLWLVMCFNNSLSSLPELPPLLTILRCSNNVITALPELPDSLNTLDCHSNNLTSLPELPAELLKLLCYNNQITCLPTLPMTLTNPAYTSFDISSNPFTCLPNYVPAMNSEWLSYPLCGLGDFDANPYGCSSVNGIAGTVFNDNNGDCAENEEEGRVVNATIKLLDEDDELLATTYTFESGENILYNFAADAGYYSVKLDTENMPFQTSCDNPGDAQEVELTTDEPSALNIDFGVECLPGFDVGVQSVVTTDLVFPGEVHTLKIVAGDMTNWYGLQCAVGVSGTVTVDVDGPVSYVGPAENTLIPTISGNLQLTYTISDFSTVNSQQDFAILLETDTTAQAEDQICLFISVDPLNGDVIPENNNLHHCYEVLNSYDPNIKQVWPQNVELGFDGYFNYTIYFQNTGTAPAFNIRLADTLDTNLDLNTFEVTAYSHACLTYVEGNVATFRFNNIMLPDSTSDFDGSIGYVQYRIKPIADLPVGTVIENTAHIYFDFNDAIVTNTTQNEYVITTSVSEQTSQSVQVFPNPGTGMYNVSLKNAASGTSTMEVFTLSGVRVEQQPLNSQQTVLDLTHQPPGMYLLRVQNELGNELVKIVKY